VAGGGGGGGGWRAIKCQCGKNVEGTEHGIKRIGLMLKKGKEAYSGCWGKST